MCQFFVSVVVVVVPRIENRDITYNRDNQRQPNDIHDIFEMKTNETAKKHKISTQLRGLAAGMKPYEEETYKAKDTENHANRIE